LYRKKKRSWAKHLDFIVLDILAAYVAYFIAFFVRFDGAILFFVEDGIDFIPYYENLAGMLVFMDLVVVLFTESYTGILRRTKYQEIASTLYHTIFMVAGILVYLWVNQITYEFSRLVVGYFGVANFAISYLVRVIHKRRIRRQKLEDRNKAVMMVVADSDEVEQCLSEIAHNKYTDFAVNAVVVVDKDMTGQTIQGFPVVASGEDVFEYVRTHVVDEVYINGRMAEQLAGDLIEQGLTVHISLLLANKLMPNRILENYGDYIVLTSSMHIANNRQAILKRVMDIVGSIVGLLFTAIAFIFIAIPIKVQSGGSIFFAQTRIGKNGRRFKFYKFRSMYVDAEQRKAELMAQNEMDGNMFKMENDPRIIPIGHFIRKYSIDELPQFWNVLKGDMSLVGTRPPTEDEYENYAYHHKARLSIKPGLTGMWQVSGRSDITDFEDVVALDTEYISNWSLGLDIKILFKTVAVVFTAKGSK